MPPFPERFGGCVLSATIDRYAYFSLRPLGTQEVRVVSEDIGIDATFDPHDGVADIAHAGKLSLAQAIFRRFRARAIDCYMHSDAPPGSGLGSSSAMIVASIVGIARHQGLELSNDEIAELAVAVERDDLGIAGGLQDQYAAAFGGFNFIEFTDDAVFVTPLRLGDDAIAELHYHLLLCFTGQTRVSSNILREQTQHVVDGNVDAISSLLAMRDMAVEMKRSLLKGRFNDVGGLLDDAWSLKRTIASNISNVGIEELYDAAKSAGAIGGKILGAGGGGYLLVFVPFNRRARVRERLEACGGRVVDFQFDQRGARAWPAPSEAWFDA